MILRPCSGWGLGGSFLDGGWGVGTVGGAWDGISRGLVLGGEVRGRDWVLGHIGWGVGEFGKSGGVIRGGRREWGLGGGADIWNDCGKGGRGGQSEEGCGG